MRRYVASRLLLAIPTLFLVSVMVFSIIHLLPGDPISLIYAQSNVVLSDEAVNQLRARLGLHRPLYEQYLRWLGQVVTGDLGNSFWSGQPVLGEILGRMEVTLEMSILALVVGMLTGVPLGLLAAVRQDSVADYIGRSVTIAGLSIPSFWIGTMAVVFPAIWFGWVPPIRYATFYEDPVSNLGQLAIPACILGLHIGATVMRMTRTTMLEVLRQDFIRTARSKGLRENAVILRHALRNALGPVAALVGISFAVLISGAIVLEQIFVIPGVGTYLIRSIQFRDYPALQVLNLFVAAPIILVNVLADVVVGILDPRIRYR